MAGRPGLDFYELRHCAATMLLERGMTPWDVAVQLGHQDGGRLVTSLYGHPSEAAARRAAVGGLGSVACRGARDPFGNISGADAVTAPMNTGRPGSVAGIPMARGAVTSVSALRSRDCAG
jgi:hypothetical protein